MSFLEQYQIKKTYDQLSQFSQGYNNLNAFILDYTLSPCSISARAEECTLMASHYGVEYALTYTDPKLFKKLRHAKTNKSLKLPEPNIFLPEFLDILPFKGRIKLTHQTMKGL